MSANILIVTSSTGFGELIRQTLAESGRYRPVLALTGQQALQQARVMPFGLAIVDAGLIDLPLAQVVGELRSLSPGLRLVLVPPEEASNQRRLDALAPDGYLPKPFYLPDLLEVVEHWLDGSPPGEEAAAIHDPAALNAVFQAGGAQETAAAAGWLSDADRIAQRLASLALASEALAALVVRQGELWAYAGQLSQAAAQEIAAVLRRNPPAAGNGHAPADVARPLRLEATGERYMIYSTSAYSPAGGPANGAAGAVLGLVFPPDTPFSRMRGRAASLSRALIETTLAAPPPQTPSAVPAWQPHELQPPAPLDPPAGAHSWLEGDLGDAGGVSPLLDEDGIAADDPLLPLPELRLGDVPPPDPQPGAVSPDSTGEPSGSLWVQEFQGWSNEFDAPPRIPELPAPPPSWAAERPLELFDTAPEADEAQPEADDDWQEEFQQAAYACLLAPRLPFHTLDGEIARRLTDWVNGLCLAFGWRLELLEICPSHLQWVASAPPTTAPAQMVATIRRQTSRRLFAAFPRLAEDNPSGDFWAQGYLVHAGLGGLPEGLTRRFLAQTRRRQGLPPD